MILKCYDEKTKQWFDVKHYEVSKSLTPCDPPPEFAQPNVEEAKRLIKTVLSCEADNSLAATELALALLSGK